MKRLKVFTLLLALILILCACAPSQNNPPTTDTTDQPQVIDPQPDQSNGNTATPPSSDVTDPATEISLDALTVEVVVEWENVDHMLSQLNRLTELLQTSLEESGCTIEYLAITINTAGGITAQALSEGGVDVAILPAVDFISCENDALALAISSEELCETAIAVVKNNQALDSTFRTALLYALLETDDGHEFLNICRADAVFAEPTEDALQLVRDYVAELEEINGGHEA